MFFFELLLLPILFFILLSLIILPFKFIFISFFNLINIPVQILKIATNKQLRINHALEHATINVLEREFRYTGLTGYAKENGFIIQGKIHPVHLERAALIGLKRLQNGESDLVIHRRCGTSMLAANFLAALIFVILLWQTGMISLLNIILAILIAQLAGPTVGQLMQKFFTTSPEVKDVNITGVDYQANQMLNFFGFALRATPREFFVKTEKAGEVEVIRL